MGDTIPEYPGELVILRAGEWSGLYVDGVLVQYGDHYVVDEWIQIELGVAVRESDAWLEPDGRTPLRQYAEVKDREAGRTKLRQDAQAKRDQAARLLNEAADLERTAAGHVR